MIIFGQWAKRFLPIGEKNFAVIVKTAFYLTAVSFWGSFTLSNLYILEKFRLLKQKLHDFSTENFRQDGRHNLLLVLWKILMEFSLFYFFPIISKNVLRFCWKSFPRDVKTAFYMSTNTKKNILNFFLDLSGILSQLLLKNYSVSLAELHCTCPEEQFEKSFFGKNFEKFFGILAISLRSYGRISLAEFSKLHSAVYLSRVKLWRIFSQKTSFIFFLDLERTFLFFGTLDDIFRKV